MRIIAETADGIGTGSDLVINSEGYVVTNQHVIDEAMTIGVVPTDTDYILEANVTSS